MSLRTKLSLRLAWIRFWPNVCSSFFFECCSYADLSLDFAHLFIRDPLVIYSDKIYIDDAAHNDHFENIQSTNWQTVRFKPPPPGSPIGWRVEFRPMEVQFSDFENAAYVAFAALLTRIISFRSFFLTNCYLIQNYISSFDLNLYMPLSLVDKNMQLAQKRDAVRQEKFYFRKHITAGMLFSICFSLCLSILPRC